MAGLSIYYRDMTCFDGLYLKKSRSACSVLGQNINISFALRAASRAVFHYMCIKLIRIQAYLSIFTLVMPSKANQFNKY